MIVDANVLLYAVDALSPHHTASARWLADALNGDRRVALPWQTIGAFLRISTHPRAVAAPLSPADAWSYVGDWLDAPPVWVPPATERTASILGDVVRRHSIGGNLVPDAMLVAMAVEHGVPVVSADSDFARFPEVTWINPSAT